jgi:hypothetical protein
MLSFATALAVILPTLGSQAYPTTTPVGSAPADDLAATWDVIVIGEQIHTYARPATIH